MRWTGPLIIGVAGVAILVSLGRWQLDRLVLKEAKIAGIEAMLGAAPVELPPAPGPESRYLAVRAAGYLTGESLEKLDSLRDQGPGRRIVAVLDLGGRRVMVDLGIRLDGTEAEPRGQVVVTGNLDWPQEADSYTPKPEGNLWFARDVTAMARALDAEPTLIVADRTVVDGIVAMPVDTSSIPNDHWHYALTWFSLAFVWFGMTLGWMWRIRRATAKAG